MDVPKRQREAALRFGAPKWESPGGRCAFLPAWHNGLRLPRFSLRALGENMAVAMVIGNLPASAALFFSGFHDCPELANEFAEASGG